MITISLCMIVKNESEVLARCLDSIRDAVDEIIIIDTGSDDNTREIARRYTDHVYDFEWIDDFSAARNYSFSKASMDYCMWLDADDVLAPEARAALCALKETLDPSVAVVMMKYDTAFDASGRAALSYYRERLIRRGAGMSWAGAIHEAIAPVGKVLHTDIAVSHRKLHAGDPDRNLRIFEKLLARGQPLCPREQFYYARELFWHGQYEKAAQVLRTFLDGGQGWIENNIEACRQLAACLRQLGDESGALRALLRSLEYDAPRAELCCDIGAHFLERQAYHQAIFWYRTAASCKRCDATGAFVCADCYDYIPFLQLCVCFDRLGDHSRAKGYNNLAAVIRPGSAAVLHNRSYFARIGV